ncbi:MULTISPECIES: immunity 53 family protein [Burkholderia cepacia complex]|uniref:Immunity 53 family protein n=1 Tax=Burkholderia pyrrocinia TaxID=60550 RepID=A0ABZ3BGW6_BURPY|nr:immunity 53 family protein [Burkholderia stabilis]
MSDLIDVLQNWYTSQCDDVWEHSYGVEITNIDNPGWRVKVSGASGRKPVDMNAERDEENWITVKATETEFVGYGGPGNLSELLALVVDWLR